MIKDLRNGNVRMDRFQRIGIQLGPGKLLTAAALRHTNTRGSHDHRIAKAVSTARIQAHTIRGDPINVVIISSCPVRKLPMIRSPHQHRGTNDNLRPHQSRYARKLGEISIITDNHAYFTNRSVNTTRLSSRSRPPSRICQTLRRKRMCFAINTQETLRAKQRSTIINNTARASLIRWKNKVNIMLLRDFDTSICEPPRNFRDDIPKIRPRPLGSKTRCKALRKNNQTRTAHLHTLANHLFRFINVRIRIHVNRCQLKHRGCKSLHFVPSCNKLNSNTHRRIS